jgi:hypothetical protein
MEINLPLVVCVWKDAYTDEDGISLDDVHHYHKPTLVTTIGWCLLHNEEGITLVNEYYDKVYRGRTFIPAAMIQSVTPYTLAKPRKKREIKPPI